jgi:hypothetical protein
MDKISGYLAFHRNTLLLVATKILNTNELVLFLYLLSQMDFDPKHPKYGTFEYFPEEIGRDIFHKSKETINTWFSKLESVGMVYMADDLRSLWSIHNPARYVINSPGIHGEANQYQKEEKGDINAMYRNIRKPSENIEPVPEQTTKYVENIRETKHNLLERIPSIGIGSYKGGISYLNNSLDTANPTMAEDDKQWINGQLRYQV